MEQKKRLGELLLEAGVIDETQLQSALGHQRRWGMKLGQALLDLKLVTEPQVVAALARKFGYDVANLSAVTPGPLLDAALKLVPKDVAAKHTLLPIASDTNSVTVAMSDPTNIAVVDELSFRTGRRVRICIAGERELSVLLRRLYFGEEARRGPEPIAFDEGSDAGIETTADPFAALPEHLRQEFLGGPSASPPPQPALEYRASPTPPPVLRPAGVTPAIAPFRPAPAPPVAAPPLARAAQRTPPPPPMPGPFPAFPRASEPEGEVVEMSDIVSGHPEPLQPREAVLADAITRLTRDLNREAAAARVAAALVRVLARKGYLTELEFLDELARRG